MKIYLVGGAVRDALLGLPVVDRDWVVVGATPEEMVSLGFLPVGKDFPVFLHRRTHEEYALARTERKTAPGYKGFVIHAEPDVTLEQDLARRDLTINSIAVESILTRAKGTIDVKSEEITPQSANLIDPFGGQSDLANKVLRHVTVSFREDPVRILRVARFAARFPDFSVAPETLQLMREMVAHGEADHLVAERVWQELSKGLMAGKPSRMFTVLRDCGALERLLPGIAWGPACDLVLDLSAQLNASLPVRFACLKQSGSDPNSFNALRVPAECRDLGQLVTQEHGNIDHSGVLDAKDLVLLLQRCDAFRKPARFADLLLACECLWRGQPGQLASAYPQRQHLLKTLGAAQSVATQQVASEAISAGAAGPEIGDLILAARIDAVARQPGWGDQLTSARAP